jgi:hypothetical protein
VTARDERLTTMDLARERTSDPAGTTDAPAADERTIEDDETAEPLLPSADGEGYQRRWREIQVRFVDEPQTAVEDADGLVAELMQRLASTFAQERERLETEWERGDEVSTEDLRRAMQHYRSFFHRLLAA